MVNHKQILEAVNRGIQLALDDFDDDEVQNAKSKQINHRDYTKEYLDLMEDVVDLDLPSGTLWCKYNLGVDPNQLNTKGDWYGRYYAWGELIYGDYKGVDYNKTDEYFRDDNYKFGSIHLTKYCEKDGVTKLLPEDDAAYQCKKCHNFKFHIPTKEQCEELLQYTKNYWVNNYDPSKIEHNLEDDGGIKRLTGRVFEGKNGNQMFIPAAGYRYDYDIRDINCCCNLWSSSLKLDNPRGAYELTFDLERIRVCSSNRYYGFTIRPVVNI